jgi:endonuclease/exonuclease/phosphatase family metal-dependent hydrolase
MGYDKKYWKRTIEYHEEGHSIRNPAKTFGISSNTLDSARRRLRREYEDCRLPQIIAICKRIIADIFVLTETDSALDLGYKSRCSTLPSTDAAAPYRDSEKRVAIYADYEIIRQHETFDEQTAICAELRTDYGELLAYGVVMGVCGNRRKNYMADLSRVLSDIDRLTKNGNSLCICGDFNCSFSDNYYYTVAGRIAIEEAFARNDIELLTRKHLEYIDHIAVSREFIGAATIKAVEWNHDKKLSDYKGVWAELEALA